MNGSTLPFLILLVSSPVIIFLIHMAVGRIYFVLKPNSSPLIGVIWASGIGFAIIGFVVWRTFLPAIQDDRETFWLCVYGTIVFSGFAVSYFILFAMTEAARRIRIMCDLYRHGAVTLDDLENFYGAKGMLSARLERMVALGQLKQRETRYYASGQLLYLIGKIIRFWSRLLKFED